MDFKRRHSAREYVCPLCLTRTTFQQELKLWEHAKQLHTDYMESKLKGDESQKRKQFSEEALQKVYVITTLEAAFEQASTLSSEDILAAPDVLTIQQ